jgi:hypothetical protein
MPRWTGQPLAYPTVQKTGAAAKNLYILIGKDDTVVNFTLDQGPINETTRVR